MPSSKLFCGLVWLFICSDAAVTNRHQSARAAPTEYIFVSQPGHHSVAVTEVNSMTRKVVRKTRPLITTGLREPCGLAVDHARQRLYVADPKSHKVFMYKMYLDVHGLHVHDSQFVAVRDITSRWVTVDERGALLCTDEGHSFVAEVSADALAHLGEDDVQPQFQKLYSKMLTKKVDHPGGIAVNGNNIYWGNGVRGHPHGSILSAPEDPQALARMGMHDGIQALSSNVDKVYGVCSSPSLVFYTAATKRSVFGTKPGALSGNHDSRKSAKVLLNDFAIPRGCVWDGDGTVFLADKGSDVVWSFPSAMHISGVAQATKLFNVKDPYGIAVFRASQRPQAMSFLLRGGALQTHLAFATLLMMLLCGYVV